MRRRSATATTGNLKGLASSSERFNYLYSPDELHELATEVTELSRKTRRVHVFFNNNYGDYGVRNAADLSKLLTATASVEPSA